MVGLLSRLLNHGSVKLTFVSLATRTNTSPGPAPPAAFFDENHARRAGTDESLVPSSEVLHVLDQSALIFVAQLVAIVMAFIFDEVGTSAHCQHPLDQGSLPFGVVDGAELVELRFRSAIQDSIDVGLQDGFRISRIDVR